MKLSFGYIENVKQVKLVSGVTTYGIGLLTYIITSFCHLFGTECSQYDEKINNAKNSAITKMIEKAKQFDADGIMDIHIQMHGLSVMVYGIAYAEKKAD